MDAARPAETLSAAAVMAAIDEVEKLADWVHRNDEAVWEWRTRTVAEKARD